MVYNSAAMKIQLRREAALSTTTVEELQTVMAAHVLCHAICIKIVNIGAALMQCRLDVFVNQNDS